MILAEHLEAVESPLAGPPDLMDEANEALPLRVVLAEVERRMIARALAACKGNRTRTAERLGISRRQLFDKLREHGLGD